MKKIELHVHLDGSVRPSTVSELLNISLEEAYDNMVVSNNNKNLSEYLTKFSYPIKIMQTKDNLFRVAKELALDLKKDDVIYAEVRFAPMFHTDNGLEFDDIVSSVLNGFNVVAGIKINLILCMMRGMEYNKNYETIMCAKRFLNRGVVALDLAGDEKKYDTKDYKELFDLANKFGIPFTIHAGEACGIESIIPALEFGAKRLGHGIRALESNEVLNYIKNNGITLEICPTSNIQTNVFDNYEDYPLMDLVNKGIKVTINTDNRTVSNTNLDKEYGLLKKHLKIKDSDLKKFNINAVDASFLNLNDKDKLKKILKQDKGSVKNEKK